MTTAAALRRLIICAIGVTCVVGVGAQAPDNTERNTRVRQSNAKTADQQSNTKSDVELTRQIRRSIVADKALSTNAHNVKVITRGGKVTLKGPVRNQGEKEAIEAKAIEIAGVENVSNQINITETTKASRTPVATPKER
jgi:hyperosmotically inducible protein